jgi:hypothetical protein
MTDFEKAVLEALEGIRQAVLSQDYRTEEHPRAAESDKAAKRVAKLAEEKEEKPKAAPKPAAKKEEEPEKPVATPSMGTRPPSPLVGGTSFTP